MGNCDIENKNCEHSNGLVCSEKDGTSIKFGNFACPLKGGSTGAYPNRHNRPKKQWDIKYWINAKNQMPVSSDGPIVCIVPCGDDDKIGVLETKGNLDNITVIFKKSNIKYWMPQKYLLDLPRTEEVL